MNQALRLCILLSLVGNTRLLEIEVWSYRSSDPMNGVRKTAIVIRQVPHGLIFVEFVDSRLLAQALDGLDLHPSSVKAIFHLT